MKENAGIDASLPQGEIRIDQEGVWSYKGVEMPRRDIVRLFYQHLHLDPLGRYFIEIGQQRCLVHVEDTAYVVWAVYWTESGNEAEDCIHLLLSDDSVEGLNPGTLRIGRDNRLYCRVKNLCFDACFSRSSYYRLAERIKHDPLCNAFYISLKGLPHYIADSR